MHFGIDNYVSDYQGLDLNEGVGNSRDTDAPVVDMGTYVSNTILYASEMAGDSVTEDSELGDTGDESTDEECSENDLDVRLQAAKEYADINRRLISEREALRALQAQYDDLKDDDGSPRGVGVSTGPPLSQSSSTFGPNECEEDGVCLKCRMPLEIPGDFLCFRCEAEDAG